MFALEFPIPWRALSVVSVEDKPVLMFISVGADDKFTILSGHMELPL